MIKYGATTYYENLLKEIARIASGEITTVSLQYAKELINKL